MRVCGIDIKANEIIVCILSLDRGLFEAPEIRQRRINISNTDDPKQLRAFQQTVSKLMDDYKVDKIAIKGRMQKGKFAGSASGFKLEAALQLLETHRANLITAAVVKETQKYDPLPVSFRDTGLKAYQEQAFMAAYTQLVGPRYPAKPEPKEAGDESSNERDAEDEAEATPAAEKPRFVRAEKPYRKPETAVKPDAAPQPQAEPEPEPAKPAAVPKSESPWGQAKSSSKPASPAKESPWGKKRD